MPDLGDITTAKPQPTLKGYSAWVINRLIEAKAITSAEVTAWIIERWIDENAKFLSEEFGIARQEFIKRGKVVPYPTAKQKTDLIDRVAEKGVVRRAGYRSQERSKRT